MLINEVNFLYALLEEKFDGSITCITEFCQEKRPDSFLFSVFFPLELYHA